MFDVVVCYGGEEFVFVFLEIDVLGVCQIVEWIVVVFLERDILYEVLVVGFLFLLSIGLVMVVFGVGIVFEIFVVFVDEVFYCSKKEGCNWFSVVVVVNLVMVS